MKRATATTSLVDDGLPYLAEVVSIEHARVHVQPIVPGRPSLAPRTVRPAWLAGVDGMVPLPVNDPETDT